MLRSLAGGLAALVFLCSVSRADVISGVIYTNFGPGDSFITDSGAVVAGAADQRPSFELPGSIVLVREVDFVASIGSITDLNQVTVTLSSDSGGHPGTAIASHEFDDAMGILGSETDPPGILTWDLTLEQGGAPELAANGIYWITLDSPAPGNVSWNYNDQSQFGDSIFLSGEWSATDNTLGALRILGDSETPEPGTFLLLSSALAAAVVFKRRTAR